MLKHPGGIHSTLASAAKGSTEQYHVLPKPTAMGLGYSKNGRGRALEPEAQNSGFDYSIYHPGNLRQIT